MPNNATALYYDYYEKDHLGNTRVVLTDQGHRVVYAATMELANAATEQLLFDSIKFVSHTKQLLLDCDKHKIQFAIFE